MRATPISGLLGHSTSLLLILRLAALLPAARLAAHPRMIAYEYTNCIQCHISPQGRGLLNGYGRGIDMEQSLSQVDLTARALGAIINPSFAEDSWKGQVGRVLLDFVSTSRLNYDIEKTRADGVFYGIYRQTIFLNKKRTFRISTEVGLRDTELANTKLAPGLTTTGGDKVFLKKATLDWRLGASTSTSGSEISVGRDSSRSASSSTTTRATCST